MEVTGRTSRDDSIGDESDRTIAIYCDPCENEGDKQPAVGFCVDCQEYLCCSCFKIHRRPAVWRHHVLMDKESMPKSKTIKEQLNYECTEPCSEHPSKILEYFCQTHAQLGCPLCITKNHRTCNDVDYIPDIAGKFQESSEVNEVFGTLKDLKERIETYSTKVSSDKIKVNDYKNNAKAQILQLRDEFNSICDGLIENVEEVSQCDTMGIDGSISKSVEILKKIKLRKSILEKKQEEMKLSQLFTEAKLSKLYAKDYANEFEVVKEQTKIRHYEINFDVEALREELKLTFHDTPVDGDILNTLSSNNTEFRQAKVSRQALHQDTGKADETKTRVWSSQGVKQRQATVKLMAKKNDGRIKYDNDFILKFRYCSYALQKPKHLPDIPDIILEKPFNQKDVQEIDEFGKGYRWESTKKKVPDRVKISSINLTKPQTKDSNYSINQSSETMVVPYKINQSSKTMEVPYKSKDSNDSINQSSKTMEVPYQSKDSNDSINQSSKTMEVPYKINQSSKTMEVPYKSKDSNDSINQSSKTMEVRYKINQSSKTMEVPYKSKDSDDSINQSSETMEVSDKAPWFFNTEHTKREEFKEYDPISYPPYKRQQMPLVAENQPTFGKSLMSGESIQSPYRPIGNMNTYTFSPATNGPTAGYTHYAPYAQMGIQYPRQQTPFRAEYQSIYGAPLMSGQGIQSPVMPNMQMGIGQLRTSIQVEPVKSMIDESDSSGSSD